MTVTEPSEDQRALQAIVSHFANIKGANASSIRRELTKLYNTFVCVRSSSLDKQANAIVVSLKKSNGTSKNGRGDVSAGGKLAEKRIDPKGVQPTARGK
jgi:hypothetical protein